jgi:hypothetical protein
VAELILSDDDKAAARWLEMDDASVGKLVKYTQLVFLREDEERERVWTWSAALLLCGIAHVANAGDMVLEVDGITLENGAVPIGDWEVVVRRRQAGGDRKGDPGCQ